MTTEGHGVRTRVEAHPTARAVVLDVGGEIDGVTAEAVEQAVERALTEAAATGASLLAADLSGVTFCASAGFTTLLYAQRRARQEGLVFAVVVNPGNPVRRLLILSTLDQVLTLHETVEQALAARS
ncbi:STAS domain-containing protein [Actinosynnema sp. NPDC023658]|uniref:STAS domain-containing protein n=1 Tax=Actinosynnema sp. NPDC023658 TaxID=3155465 RepID=UPI0034017A8F